MIRLYYKHNKLDNKHEFMVITDKCFFESWFWFYFGKHYENKKGTDILMSKIEGSAIIGTANNNDAESSAKKIIRLIGEHMRHVNDLSKKRSNKSKLLYTKPQ